MFFSGGLTSRCLSIDSDLFALGSKLLVFVESWAGLGSCFIVQRDIVLPKLAEDFGILRPLPLTDDEVRALCLLHGNDYITNAFGPQTLKKGKFIEYLNDPAAVLNGVDRDPIKSPSSSEPFSDRFKRMLHFSKHPPCFVVSGAGGTGIVSEAEWNAKSYSVTLDFMRGDLAQPPASTHPASPGRPLPSRRRGRQLPPPPPPPPPAPLPSLTDLCGFDPKTQLGVSWESAMALAPELLLEFFSLQRWPRTGLRLRGLRVCHVDPEHCVSVEFFAQT